MSIGQDFLREFDEEMATTRRVLERVPTDKGQWKPHPKSFSMGHLAQLVSWMPGWVANTLRNPSLDLAASGGYSYETTETLLKGFDANVRDAREALTTVPDRAWGEKWTLKRGDMVLWSAPRAVVIRTHINHLVHHRAQLGVYLRLNDIPVPAMYGPTADERPF
ncbi:MAG TPA: DinB family protein [Gemmatimonadaceae bacterium]|nr:DinB family protein [Gemmatimonadaceae bacterium]